MGLFSRKETPQAPVYRAWADAIAPVLETPTATATSILSLLDC